MKSRSFWAVVTMLTSIAPGCDPDEGFYEDDEHIELRPDGGVWLNTNAIGALEFSQLDMSGDVLDGLALTDVYVRVSGQDVRLDSLGFNAWKLEGHRGPTRYSGADLVDSRWILDPVQGQPVEMWISAVTQASNKEYHYTFMTNRAAPVYVCDPDLAGDHSAVAIEGITVDPHTGVVSDRPDTLYIACLSGAVGKAFTHGYDPETIGVADFEVAVRMLRADYCYDGTSWTTVGRALQVRDDWTLDSFLFSALPNEAAWTRTGLACIGQPRNPLYPASLVICDGATKPTCPTNLGMQTYANTLFWTKLGI